jgi:hypothetical protein
MNRLPFHKGPWFDRLPRDLVVAALSFALLAAATNRLAAQAHDARDDGAAARTDAMLGTPNRTTPVPQTNKFATSPGLEQQPREPRPPGGSEGAGSGGSPGTSVGSPVTSKLANSRTP